MPLGAMLKSTLLVPAKTLAQQPTGEWKPSYDYSSADPIACRIYDRSADARQARFGDTLEVEAVVLVPASVGVEPLLLAAGTGERQQVKVDGVAYEALEVRDQGRVGRIKEIWVKRWK